MNTYLMLLRSARCLVVLPWCHTVGTIMFVDDFSHGHWRGHQIVWKEGETNNGGDQKLH